MATQLELIPPLSQVQRPMTHLPPILSFFSGAGFLDLGLIRAGFDVAWSLEADPRICEAHNAGMQSYFTSQGLCQRLPLIASPEKIEHKGPRAILREASGT